MRLGSVQEGFDRHFEANLAHLGEILERFNSVLGGTGLPQALFGRVWRAQNVFQNISQNKMAKHGVFVRQNTKFTQEGCEGACNKLLNKPGKN